MKTTTTLVHTLEIDYYKALKRFIELNNDITNNLVDYNTEELYMHLQSYTQAVKDIQQHKMKNVCQEGYTMMLLSHEESVFVEKFFADDPDKEEIQLKVVRDGEVVEIISSDYLQY